MQTQTSKNWKRVVLATLVIMGALTVQAKDTAGKLPETALAVINAKYPGCSVQNVEIETEHKIRFFAVEINLPGRKIEVEISAAGDIIESEEEVKTDTLSPALRAEVTKLTDSGRTVVKIERHEVLCAPCLGTFRQLAKPILFYDLKIRNHKGRKQSVLLEQDAKQIINVSKIGDNDNDDDDDDD
ncbi:MAG: hypothetical protein WCT05_08475 [Lentisphaeria bacterium]